MHRMTQYKLNFLVAVIMAIAITTTGIQKTNAAPPDVRHANLDFDGSGYVTPAGMVPPSLYQGGVMPVGFQRACDSGCDAPGCDGMSCSSGGCSSGGCSTGGCTTGGCGSSGSGIFDQLGGGFGFGGCCTCGLLKGGLLGKLRNGGCAGCGANLRHMCIFCRGGGCSACQLLGRGYLLGALNSLRPYTEGGLCAQRWYDVSLGALFLGHTSGNGGEALTTLGVGPGGQTVLSLGDAADGDDIEAGLRFSVAMIFGAGGNLEGTYMGGNEWSSRAEVRDPSAGLFSTISDFGTDPIGGFDDTDRSIRQRIETESEFHSAEINYRRRLVGPYCRFQGSWLVGLRYVQFESGLRYSTLGENDNTVNANLPRFFSSDDEVKNNLFGPQAGFDLWWNASPGISLGIGSKFAWVQNDIDRRTIFQSNSLDPIATPGAVVLNNDDRDTTVFGDFEFKLAYRLSRSWTFRSSYYLLVADDIAFGSFDREAARDFVTVSSSISTPDDQVSSLVVQGFSFGGEYLW